MLSVLRRVELLHLTRDCLEVCAEADVGDEEICAFANAEHGGGWVRVIRGEDEVLHPMVCIYDRRRMHFCVVRDERHVDVNR